MGLLDGAKEAEEALRKSNEKYRALLQAIPDMIFRFSKEGVFLEFKPSLEFNPLQHPGDFLGKTINDTMPPEMAQKAMKYLKQTIKTGKIQNFEYQLPSKNGLDYFEARLVICGKDEVLAIIRNISERKKAEEKLRRRLMRYKLEKESLYIVQEPSPFRSLEAFQDLLDIGANGMILSRTPKTEFHGVDGVFEYFWLAERGKTNFINPKIKNIKPWFRNVLQNSAILIDGLDYLISKNGFDDVLSFVQTLREFAYIEGHTIIISIDPSTLSKRELRLIEKEGKEIEPMQKVEINPDFLDALKFIYLKNTNGINPSYIEIKTGLGISRPTVRKRIKELVVDGYVKETLKGNKKSVEVTEKGRHLFF